MTGNELRAIRSRLGLTLAGMAERMNLHLNTLARMERGEITITQERAWQARAIDEESRSMITTAENLKSRLYGQPHRSLDAARQAAGISTQDVFTGACRANGITFTGFSTGLWFHDQVEMTGSLQAALEREIPANILAGNQLSVRPPLPMDLSEDGPFHGEARPGDVVVTHAIGTTVWGEWLFRAMAIHGWRCIAKVGEVPRHG